tara:strand:+ start:331 stop:768 length:438 start_codon:yes stop_codon:yes gene_type:complete
VIHKIQKGYFSDSTSSDEDMNVIKRHADGDVVNLIVIEEFGQDMTTLKNVVARYILIVSEIERMLSTLKRFDLMYKEAREYVMELGYEMKDVRNLLKELREEMEKHTSVIRSIERARLIISKIRKVSDEDMGKNISEGARMEHCS